jgi:hypothetical protein
MTNRARVRSDVLVMTPAYTVGELVNPQANDRVVIVRPNGASGRERTEAFSWSELVVLREARKLRRPPTARVETSIGSVELTATASSEKKYGRDYDDLVRVSCVPAPPDPETYWKRREPLVVNRVEYDFSASVARNRETGAWEAFDVHLYRQKRVKSGNTWATSAAYDIARRVIPAEVGAWLVKHEHFLDEAHRVVLSNKIAAEEGEILAAKRRYEDAVAKRAALLAQEAQR